PAHRPRSLRQDSCGTPARSAAPRPRRSGGRGRSPDRRGDRWRVRHGPAELRRVQGAAGVVERTLSEKINSALTPALSPRERGEACAASLPILPSAFFILPLTPPGVTDGPLATVQFDHRETADRFAHVAGQLHSPDPQRHKPAI